MRKLRIKKKILAIPPKDVELSDGGPGVVVGTRVYRKLPSGQLVHLGEAQKDGSIVGKKPNGGKKK